MKVSIKYADLLLCLIAHLPNELLVRADWTEQQEDPKNAGLWERDWDDDSLSDDFSKSLREQLSKPAKPTS